MCPGPFLDSQILCCLAFLHRLLSISLVDMEWNLPAWNAPPLGPWIRGLGKSCVKSRNYGVQGSYLGRANAHRISCNSHSQHRTKQDIILWCSKFILPFSLSVSWTDENNVCNQLGNQLSSRVEKCVSRMEVCKLFGWKQTTLVTRKIKSDFLDRFKSH